MSNKYLAQTQEPFVSPAGFQPGARPYLHTIEAGMKLPLMQSMIWGLLAMAVALVIVLSGSPIWPDSLVYPAGAFIAGAALAWWNYQAHWFKLSNIEKFTGLDLNRDGKIGNETPLPRRVIPVQINEITAQGHLRVSKMFDLPATPEQMEMLAYGLLRQNIPFTFREWSGKGKPFSDNEFENLRSEMIKRGLVAASGAEARRGLVLTVIGRRVIADFLPERAQNG